jgi:hypothetical protein
LAEETSGVGGGEERFLLLGKAAISTLVGLLVVSISGCGMLVWFIEGAGGG